MTSSSMHINTQMVHPGSATAAILYGGSASKLAPCDSSLPSTSRPPLLNDDGGLASAGGGSTGTFRRRSTICSADGRRPGRVSRHSRISALTSAGHSSGTRMSRNCPLIGVSPVHISHSTIP